MMLFSHITFTFDLLQTKCYYSTILYLTLKVSFFIILSAPGIFCCILRNTGHYLHHVHDTQQFIYSFVYNGTVLNSAEHVLHSLPFTLYFTFSQTLFYGLGPTTLVGLHGWSI